MCECSTPPTAAITDSQAEGTIIDQNDLPRATIADTEAVEGAGSAEFTVTLSHASTAPITFLYSTIEGATIDGAAKDPDDYVAITDGSLTMLTVCGQHHQRHLHCDAGRRQHHRTRRDLQRQVA